ncbi:MAG TPA: MBL fold metallo-hydrolase [Stellaceae bacterium]|nr:MBL fold metallo-hydrolase [Stellaceae bacterium]
MRSAAGTTIVLDCGTGALSLGADLMHRGEGPIRGHLLISHTHWDHIQGLPFFVPLFVPGNEWDVYAPHGFLHSVRETLAGQMQHTYFPVDLGQLGATIRYHNLTEGSFTVGDIRVQSRYLNHPALTLGYRLDVDGVSLAYCCDHEPHSRPLAYGEGEIGDQDHEHIAFIQGADLLIHDAQYRAPEYEGKMGWGHSTLEYVMAIARLAEVKTLAFTHHDPLRDDDTIDREVAQLRDTSQAAGSPLNIYAAAEGQAIELRAMPGEVHKPLPDQLAAEIAAPPQLSDHTVLVGIADTTLYDEFLRVLHDDGVKVAHATSGAAAVALMRTTSPSVIVLDHDLPGGGLEACNAVRMSGEPGAQDIPIIMIASREEVGPGIAVGVTDWLVKPFSEIYARTRLRAWLMRMNCRWVQPRRPDNEAQRLAALHELGILDTEPEERFDRITRIATAMFDVPVALVSLIDEDRQWFKSACGFPASPTSRDISFCAHAILAHQVMVVPDALLDARFADNPAVAGEPRVRFYAGCPLVLDNGACVGTLCIVDMRPRELDAASIRVLEDLGKLVLRELQRKG